MIFLTQTGYLMLVKSFNDDLAWKIQRQLVNRYFEKPLTILDKNFKGGNNIYYSLAQLCKNADKYLGGKASLRALHFFTGMPVDDLIRELEIKQREKRAPKHLNDMNLIDFYLHAMIDDDPEQWGFNSGKDERGNRYFVAQTQPLTEALAELGIQKGLPKFPYSAQQFGARVAAYREDLERLGWRRRQEKAVKGYRYYQYTMINAETA